MDKARLGHSLRPVCDKPPNASRSRCRGHTTSEQRIHGPSRAQTDSVDGFLRDKKHLILDNDSLFTKQFCSILGDAGCEVVRTAIQAPNMNAFAERFVQTIKRECLSKLILFGEEHLRRVLSEFVEHYHAERPHQGIDNKLIARTNDEPPNGNKVVVDKRLGGLLRSYRRAA